MNTNKKKKLLIVRPDGIGDFVIFLSVLEKYRELYDGYQLDLVCNEATRELAEVIPFINKVICFDFRKRVYLKKYPFYTLISLLQAVFLKYDKVIYPVFSRSRSVDWFIRFIRAKEKITFDGDLINYPDKKGMKRDDFYTCIIKSDNIVKTEYERNFEFIKKLGSHINFSEMVPKIWFSDKDEADFREIAQVKGLNKKTYIAIFPGAANKRKCWVSVKWVELIQNILHDIPDTKIVILGHGKDLYAIQEILNGMKKVYRGKVLNLYGKTNLRVLTKVIGNAKMLISTDTVAVHLAAAVGTPNICIMGGGHFGRFYPYGDLSKNKIVYKKMDCFYCNWKCIYNYVKCIKDIKVSDVMSEVDLLMKGSIFV